MLDEVPMLAGHSTHGLPILSIFTKASPLRLSHHESRQASVCFIYILFSLEYGAWSTHHSLCCSFSHFFFELHIFATAANASLWSAFGFFFFHAGSSFFMKRLYADGGRGTLSFLAEPFLADFFADFLAIAFFGADFFAGAFCIIEKLPWSHHCSKDLCAKHLRNASQKECLDVGGIVTVIFTTRFARVFAPC